ncbi:putative membrane protein [Clostridium sporogenes]|uniref:Putative membrane protein n=1 Tax=Clostridium sporogenes TaxID=1509 RepID=A0A1L3NHG7_CLOSG|nr:putative membrane protein [Clostridium sporogenes]
MFSLSIVVLGVFIYSFLFGDRKLILLIISIVSILAIIYNIIKHTKIIKCSDEQSKYKSKLALNKVITGAVILVIFIPIMFIYLT